MSTAPAASHREVACCALLCLACGVVDAAGYLAHGIFAANMTGNTVLLGLAAAGHQWPLALERLLPLATFFGGAVSGRSLLNLAGGRAPAMSLHDQNLT